VRQCISGWSVLKLLLIHSFEACSISFSVSIPFGVSLSKTELFLCNTGSMLSDYFYGQCICKFRKYVNYKFIFHFHHLPSHSLLLSVLLAHHLVLYSAVERHIGHNPVLHHKAIKFQQVPVTRPTLALLSLFYW
jgi:hypothetical protein